MGSYQLHWCNFSGGCLALGHRPGRKLRKQLGSQGCTLVVNLLSDRESKILPSSSCRRLSLDSASPPDPCRDDDVLELFLAIQNELENEGKVFIHCSAGLHRTGMIAYAFFRFMGLDQATSTSRIAQLRQLTAIELTEIRMRWGDRFAPPLNNESQ